MTVVSQPMISSRSRRAARAPNSVVSSSTSEPYPRHNGLRVELLERIEAQIRRHDLIEPGGEVTCLVSGGADSTCLWHALARWGTEPPRFM